MEANVTEKNQGKSIFEAKKEWGGAVEELIA